MKQFLIFFISAFICLNTYGQNTYVGKIIRMRDPACTSSILPCPPCGGQVLGLETTSGNYVLSPTAYCMARFLIIEDVVYLAGDEVEITGTESIRQIDDDSSKEYFELKIETIKKIHEQNTYTGKIDWMGDPLCIPPVSPPCPPEENSTLGLQVVSGNFILEIVLTFDLQLFKDKLIVENIEYFVGDEVEIIGSITGKKDGFSREYIELEIESIKKLTSNIESVSFSNNKVYYDEKKQVIVIDETLLSQSLTFELMDMQGKVILIKTDISNNSVNIVNLLNGVYLYRLTQNGIIICTGKILKNK